MQSIIGRFLGWDRLLGPVLVKLVYYVGMAGLGIFVAVAMLTGVLALAGGNFGQGLMQLIAAPAVGAVALVYWRFVCELFMLAFLAYQRLGEVRDALRGAPDPDHPAF